MRILVSLLCAVLVCAASAVAQNVTVRPAGITFKELAGTPTLVTVVLKNGAEVPNLRITELMDGHFMALSPEGDQHFYLYESVDHVLVQGGKVEKPQ
ncbi:MAG: hypothetical protein IT368_03305, partial [Candidatus Hydrogenedentes bacterium]|nr:hypothetical protein [Candidatus Hydrogenedentota bacterium]